MCQCTTATTPADNPLRDTLARLKHHTGMARLTRDNEAARLAHIEAADAIARTAAWQLENHPAYKAFQP